MKVEAVIDEVVIEPEKIQPIIIDFQNGALVDTEARKMKSGVFYDEKTQNSLVAMSNGQAVYTGYRPDPKGESTYTMLAIHNRKTGKIRLIQAENWKVGPILDRQAQKKDEVDGNSVITLNRTFGSKKVKRRTEQYEKMKVNVDTVEGQLNEAVNNVEIDRSELSTKVDEQLRAALPPCNREASIVEDAYDIHDIIPKDILQELMSKVEEIQAQERDSEFYRRTLQIIREGAQVEKKIAILEYIYSIANWLNIPSRDGRKRMKEICAVSLQISQHIVQSYSLAGAAGRTRPNSIRDKGIIHCLILSLIISNYELSLELFSSLISGLLNLKKLTELSRLIGATASRKDKKSIELKVPLPAPPALIHRGKKRNPN